jgi:uncharacterized membrane protein HdeD (DUF308 family)
MSTGSENKVAAVQCAADAKFVHELQHLRSHWWWFLLLGFLLVACGTTAVILPAVYTVAAVMVLAVVFMVAGLATIVGSFWAGKWSGFLVQLLVGILYVAAGFVISDKPLVSIVLITVFIAVSFIVMGAFRALAAMLIRFPQWGWALLNGVITLLAGIVIYRHLPETAFWVIGLLVGLEMLFNGWTWIMLAYEIRSIPKD